MPESSCSTIGGSGQAVRVLKVKKNQCFKSGTDGLWVGTGSATALKHRQFCLHYIACVFQN